MPPSKEERWLDIQGFEGLYRVSSEGRVYSVRRRLVMAPRPAGSGYHIVALWRDRRAHHQYIHRLVCAAFHGDPPDGHEVRHLDGTRTNNNEVNLAWGTRAENHHDKKRHGTQLCGERNHLSKLTSADVVEIRSLVAAGATQGSVAGLFGVTQATVGRAVRRVSWRHI